MLARTTSPRRSDQRPRRVVPIFLCPSEIEKPVHNIKLPSGVIIPVAGTNYAMNGGDGTDSYNNTLGFMANPNNGLCFVSARLKIDDIRDGTTHTLAFTESLLGPGDSPAKTEIPDTQVYRAQASTSVAVVDAVEAGGLAALLPSLKGWDGARLSYWLRGCVPGGPILNGRFTPNNPIPTSRADRQSHRRAQPSYRRRERLFLRRQRPLHH